MSADSSSLWELCKQRGITSLSKGLVPKQVNALLSHPDGAPPPSALPIKGSKGGATSGKAIGKAIGKAGASEPQALEQRLDRLERLALLIAEQMGVSPGAITQLAVPPALPPT